MLRELPLVQMALLLGNMPSVMEIRLKRTEIWSLCDEIEIQEFLQRLIFSHS